MTAPRTILAALLLLAALSVPVAAGGKKKGPETSVSFHLQTSPGVDNTQRTFKQMTAGKEITYRRVPEISTKDLAAFTSFPADDGATYGIVFQLNQQGAKHLANISTAHRGKYLLAIVNGQVRDAVIIDKPVNDGLIVIWKWITLREVRFADTMLPRIGEDPKAWKERQKKKK